MKRSIVWKGVVWLGSLFLVGLVISCNLETRFECDTQSSTYRSTGYNLFIAKGSDGLARGFMNQGYLVDRENIVSTPDSIMFIFQAMLSLGVSENTPTPQGAFFSRAMADCIPEPFRILDSLTAINITSNADYSEDYPAGTDLSTLFSIRQLNEDIGFFSEAQPVDFFMSNETANPASSVKVFRPLEMPSLATQHKFTFRIQHNNQGNYEIETPVVTFE